MSKAQFIDAVRQYASAARTKRRSFADAVHQFAQMRVDDIKKNQPDADKRSKEIANVQAFLAAEYQPWDAAFSVRSYD